MSIFPAFEKYGVPEDLIPLGDFALPGLARFPRAPRLCDCLETIAALPNPSPVKMPQRSGIYCNSFGAEKNIFNIASVFE